MVNHRIPSLGENETLQLQLYIALGFIDTLK